MMDWDRMAKTTRFLDTCLRTFGILLVILLFSYGVYSLYDNYLVSQGGFESELMKFKPKAEDPGPTFDELRAINPDVIAWLTVDDSNIDYAVVQGEDDMEYLNKNPLGEFTLSGSLFLSYLNAPDFSDAYNIIYGHHMENGAMFGDVTDFLDEKYFNAHKSGTIILPEEAHDFQIFAVIETDTGDHNVYGISQWKNNNEGFLTYLKENAEHWHEPQIKDGDVIVGMSTCYDILTNGRVVVYGVMSSETKAMPAEQEAK